jgi:DNA segregation ATPase FtsK/SpoIIIE-like protein
MKEDPRKRGAARVPSRGPELLGGVLFLAGCLPAVALLKAFRDGTDLTSDGLGGTAALAARITDWVGAWPGLMIAGAIAAFGAMAVLGAIRTDLLRRVVGVAVCGLGVAAISSALVAGSGGRIGDGTGARLAEAVGPWAGLLAGFGVVVVALWLAFAQAPKTGSRTLAVSLDGPELRRASETRPGPEVREIDTPRRKRRRKKPAPEVPASEPSSIVHQHELPEPEAVEPEAPTTPQPKPPAPRVEPAAETTPSRDEAARPSMPGLDREPDPVVDGPSSETGEGSFSFAALSGWIGGIAASLGARMGRKRPRVAMPSPKKSEPKTLGDALVRGEAEGVSHDEAAALAPDGDTLAYMEEVWRKASASLEQVDPIPPSPYPDDPRLKGEIPPGTVPLGGSIAKAPEPKPAPPAREPAPVAVPHPEVAPFDLMDDEEQGTIVEEEVHPLAPTSIDPPASEAAALDLPGGVAPMRPEDVEGIALPRPPASWEADYDDEGSSESDGTWTRGETSVAAGEEPEELEVVAEVEEESPAEAAAPAPEVAIVEPESEPDAEAEEEVEDESETPLDEFASDEDLDEDLDEDESDEEEAEGEEGVEYEYVDEDGNPIDISSLDDGAYEIVDEDEYEEVEEEDDAEYEDAEEDEAAEYEEESEESEDDESDEDPEASFDDGDEYEEADEDEEPVVLEPQSPPLAASTQSERLLNAGRVLVRQGRVAVSVLQQELDMEFDEACELLDQLQAEGLIGPYKGGKKRDILLSEEEWEDHFARS